MTLQLVNESDEDEEEYQALQEARRGSHNNDTDEALLPPMHPVASMQGAFEESIYESIEDDLTQPAGPDDAESRRQRLLEVRRYDDSWRTRWRQKSTARHHPLMKLMAQIIFGMHLLLQQQAKSDEEVVRILQTHVNEVDTFLEKTAEDFDLAIADIDERIRHLKLPMSHLDVFKVMLDDRPFRSQLMDGNAKIEKIVERSAKAMSAALADLGEGVQATNDMARYLDNTAEDWPRQKPDVAAVFNAMKGNEQGWIKYLRNLQARGQTLGKGLALLSSVISEMSKLAIAANARSRPSSVASYRTQADSPGLHSKFSREPHSRTGSQLNKPLPVAPAAFTLSRQGSGRSSPSPSTPRFDLSQPPTPNFSTVRRSMKDDVPVRPSTAGATAGAPAGNERSLSRSGSLAGRPELEKYLSLGGPLRSHPPDRLTSVGPRNEPLIKKTSMKPQSQAATDFLNAQTVSRPKSQMATLLMSRGDDNASRPSSRGGPDRAMSVKSAPTTRNALPSG